MENDVKRFEGTYFQWLKAELTGWDRFPWALFGAGVGFQLAILLLNPINWISVVSFIGIFFGMWCTVAMGAGGYNSDGERVSSHAINGLLGTISVAAYVIINVNAGHYWSVLDQLVFLFLIDIPLLKNWRTWDGKSTSIKGLTRRGWIYAAVAILVAWFVLYFVGIYLHDTNPLWDALTLAIGGTASWLCYRQYSTTFSLWLCSDFVNIALWFTALKDGYSQASLPMLAMSSFYLLSAIVGKINWRPAKNV